MSGSDDAPEGGTAAEADAAAGTDAGTSADAGADADRLAWITQGVRTRRGAAAAVLVLVALAFPYLATSNFQIFLLAQIMIFAIAALAYNVLLGYTGLLSFGHAAFFGAGAYVVGLLLRYTNIQEFVVLFALGVLGAAVIAVVYGYVSVRHTEVYYALLMLALAHMLYILALKLYTYTGGTDGLSIPAPTILGVDYADILGYNTYLEGIYYYIVVFVFVAVVAVLWLFMHSPFGLTLQAIRDSPERAEALGIPVKRYRWYASVVSGLFTGVAGVLYAFLNGHVTPGGVLHWIRSGEIAFITVLGGPTTFFGPAVGAGAFVLIRNFAISYFPAYWQFAMGAILLGAVLFMREGVVIGARDLWTWARGRAGVRGEAETAAETAETAETREGD